MIHFFLLLNFVHGSIAILNQWNHRWGGHQVEKLSIAQCPESQNLVDYFADWEAQNKSQGKHTDWSNPVSVQSFMGRIKDGNQIEYFSTVDWNNDAQVRASFENYIVLKVSFSVINRIRAKKTMTDQPLRNFKN
jgi:hypothetical protein